MAFRPLRNIGLKMAALGLGTLLWLTFSGHQIERRIYVPLSFSNLPPQLQLTGDQLDTVSVYVRGDENVVASLREGDIHVVVNLAGAEKGSNLVPLQAEQVVAPPGLQVAMIDPDTVTVTLEKVVRRSVPVRPSIDGQPPDGFRLTGVLVTPPTVTVEGPESQAGEALAAVTESISIANRTTSFEEVVGVGLTQTQWRVVQPRTVRVTVQIAPAAAEETEQQ